MSEEPLVATGVLRQDNGQETRARPITLITTHSSSVFNTLPHSVMMTMIRIMMVMMTKAATLVTNLLWTSP